MKHLYIILTFMLIFISFIVYAGPSAPPQTPIDGGLSILLVAGGLFGIKKLRDRIRK